MTEENNKQTDFSKIPFDACTITEDLLRQSIKQMLLNRVNELKEEKDVLEKDIAECTIEHDGCKVCLADSEHHDTMAPKKLANILPKIEELERLIKSLS